MARTKQTSRVRPRPSSSLPYVAHKKPRLAYECMKHHLSHIDVSFSANTKYTLPNEIFQHILAFISTDTLLRSCRSVCRSFQNIVDNNLSFWRWRMMERSLQFCDGKEFLERMATSHMCRWPLLVTLHHDGLFESQRRDLKHNVNFNQNYTDLMILGHFLLQEHERLELSLPGYIYNISFLSIIRGAHSPANMYPIILQHDIEHQIRGENTPYEKEILAEFFPEYEESKLDNIHDDNDNNTGNDNDQSVDRNQDSIMFQTVKKLFRFPSYEKEHRGGQELDQLWEKEVSNQTTIFGRQEEWTPYRRVYDRLKQRMEHFFGGKENTSLIQVGNTASEEVALCFWLGVRGSYVGGYLWLHERDS